MKRPSIRYHVARPPGFTLSGFFRRLFWRFVFHSSGGFKVSGEPAPLEAFVVVANHASHADTPALMGAFPAPYKPVVVAADDYWFKSKIKRKFLKTFIGGVPVQRVGGGGYESLLAGAKEVFGAGSSLLIFPEGTRSTDGELGHFKRGALKIAEEFNVPLLPVAIVGTHHLLPKGGKMHRGPIEVRVGKPVRPQNFDTETMKVIRNQIQAMIDSGPPEAGITPLYKKVNSFMGRPRGLVAAGVWSFAEALSFPVMSEAYLLFFAVSNPKRIPKVTLALTLGSTLGVITHHVLAKHGAKIPLPLTSEAMIAKATTDMSEGAKGIWRQAANGVPVKVYAAASGNIDTGPLATQTLLARGTRALVIGQGLMLAGRLGEKHLQRAYGPYLAGSMVSFTVGLGLIVRRWRKT